jgi:hypothetical protein
VLAATSMKTELSLRHSYPPYWQLTVARHARTPRRSIRSETTVGFKIVTGASVACIVSGGFAGTDDCITSLALRVVNLLFNRRRPRGERCFRHCSSCSSLG